MISIKYKNIKIRKIFNKIEKLKKIDKFIFINLLNKNHASLSKKKITYFLNKQLSSNNFYSKTKITNRCVFNNRGRSVLRPYGISRMLLKDLMQFGILPGFSKAVW
jgi:ribosomal protein S14